MYKGYGEILMIKKKKRLLGIVSKKIYTQTGLVKHKFLGITYKKSFIEPECAKPLPKDSLDDVLKILTNFKEYVYSLCKKDEYNLVLHRHLGDSYVLLCMKDLFEKKYQKPLHFIVRPRQKVLMDLLNISNYSILDSHELLDIQDYASQSNYIATKYMDNLEEDVFIKLFPAIPILDRPFICTAVDYIKINFPYKNFVHGWGLMLGLEVFKVKPHLAELNISQNFKEKLKNVDLDKVICFAPEANSCNSISNVFWEALANELNKKGYYIITNAVNKSNIIKNTNYIDCSLYDFICLAKHAAACFSIRSGLADILCAVSNKCYVFSTEEIFEDYFLMQHCYDLPHKVNEIRIKSELKKNELKRILKNLLEEF